MQYQDSSETLLFSFRSEESVFWHCETVTAGTSLKSIEIGLGCSFTGAGQDISVIIVSNGGGC
jgi:hypothetical protein